MVLSQEQHLGRYGEAFVTAIAESAGLTVRNTSAADFYLVDLEIGYPGPRGSMLTPKLQIQVKCTQKADVTETLVKHGIKARYYDKLVNPCHAFGNPIFLVVVVAPQNVGEWADVSKERLILKEAAYWTCLHGKPSSDLAAESKKTVIWQRDKEHLLRRESLLTMFDHAERMQRSEEGVFEL
ncbi:DUF4365 domain-containing protein [Streptosporangium sp. NBC_01639]|uniref:DUF4365 domain-containing protein n=1 Tax=Streptosporangium sp. NBC_01639 TaxID=2975948 RepID=UPI00386B860F|nr:DUF4365 domain-containing protein [Streptosporangium sp. NBC_01639]